MLSSVDLEVLEPPPSPTSLQTSTGQMSCWAHAVMSSITVRLQSGYSQMIACRTTHENDGCARQAQTIRTYVVAALLHIEIWHDRQDV